MKLDRALLCVACDEVHDNTIACPCCGNRGPSFRLGRHIQPKSRDEIAKALKDAFPDPVVGEDFHEE